MCKACVKLNTLLKGHSLTYIEYREMLVEQSSQCAICNESIIGKRLHIDHCHLLGHVRGLLCPSCNIGLGNFKDNPTRLKNAIIYLEKNETKRKWWFQKVFG